MTQFLTIAWPDNDRVLAGHLRRAARARRPPRLRLLGRLRRRGQDDRQRSGDRRVHRPDHRAVDGQRRARQGRAARPPAAGPPRRHRHRRRRLVLLRRARPQGAAGRRCAARAHLLPLRGRATGTARRHGTALRARVGAGPADEARTWHAEVATYDVSFGGERIGRIHLDLHPRDGKYKHAAQFDLARGVADVQLAEGVLVCNFNRGLHRARRGRHALPRVRSPRAPRPRPDAREWVRFSGVATEWDFVEAPSQMLEEWAWDPEVLATLRAQRRRRDHPRRPRRGDATRRRLRQGLRRAHPDVLCGAVVRPPRQPRQTTSPPGCAS